MKLTSSLFLIVLIACGFCDDSTTKVNPTTETPTTSVKTTTVTDTTTVRTTSQQTDTTTVSPTTTVPTTSQQPNITSVSPSTTVPTTSQQPTVSPSTTFPTTSQQPNTTTVSPSTTVPTTSQQPSTTTASAGTTTNPSTTASTEPPTTTVKPTITSSPDTTTSPKPTTVPPVTSTKSPEPPTPVESSWNVTEGNLTCIRTNLKVRFKIRVKDHVEYIVLSPNAISKGNCKLSDTTQELTLEDSEFILTMIFEKDSNNAYLKNVTFYYTLPDGSSTVFNDTKLYSVKLGNSYMCDSSNDINLRNVTMEVFRIHIQSFGNPGNKDFGLAEICEAENQVNEIVPVAVGIVLSIVVVVALVSYFVGQQKRRKRGYQSV